MSLSTISIFVHTDTGVEMRYWILMRRRWTNISPSAKRLCYLLKTVVAVSPLFIAFVLCGLTSPSENQVLDEFFPLPRLPSSTDPLVGEASQRTQANNAPKAMSATRLREGSSDLRPGQSFLIYNSQDILGALPADLEKIIQRASKWTGVDENYLCGVVERYERRLVRWWRDQRKADESDGSVCFSSVSFDFDLSSNAAVM